MTIDHHRPATDLAKESFVAAKLSFAFYAPTARPITAAATPWKYALANKINHPRNVYLRERDVLTPLDHALASAFAPARLHDTITRMTASQPPPSLDDFALRAGHARLADCDTKLAGYRAALDAGADPTLVTGWITEVQSQRRKIQEQLAAPCPQPTKAMTREQITTLIQQLGDITTALAEAEPTDRAEVYRQLGLRLTYHPKQQKVRVQAQPVTDSYGDLVHVRRSIQTNAQPIAALSTIIPLL